MYELSKSTRFTQKLHILTSQPLLTFIHPTNLTVLYIPIFFYHTLDFVSVRNVIKIWIL